MSYYGRDYGYRTPRYDRGYRGGHRGARGRYGADHFGRRADDERFGYHGPGTDLGVDIDRGVVGRGRRGGYYRGIDIGPSDGGPDVTFDSYPYRGHGYDRGFGRAGRRRRYG